MVSATNLAEAKAIAEAGIDVIIAQGVEAGGHRGCFNPHRDSAIKTTDLVRLILQYLDLPVVAAGGIMNGRQAQQCLALGAQAVQLGTAFVQCQAQMPMQPIAKLYLTGLLLKLPQLFQDARHAA